MSAFENPSVVQRRYRELFEASVAPSFEHWLHRGETASLGYRRASGGSLFLERYLDEPVEAAVSAAFGLPVEREAIVELGNFAADNALAMIELWGRAANDLGSSSDFVVATLTRPLRGMFARIGVPITVLAPASATRLGADAADWGSYYAQDPQVCAGPIVEGQQAIAAFVARRAGSRAA